MGGHSQKNIMYSSPEKVTKKREKGKENKKTKRRKKRTGKENNKGVPGVKSTWRSYIHQLMVKTGRTRIFQYKVAKFIVSIGQP